MRSNTTLRTAFRIGMMLAVATGVSFAATSAHADVAGAGDNASSGTAALKYEYKQGLDTTIDTGFLGPSNPTFGAQIRAVVKLDPVVGGGPLYTVDMPKGAVVSASWSGDRKILLRAANGAQTDGSVKVRHTLTPSLQLKVNLGGVGATFAFDANNIINKIPGSKFAYDSAATQVFAPWGFTAVPTVLNAPILADATLFSEPFSKFGDILPPADWDGSIGVRATTKPTFEYKTTKVMLLGSSAPLINGGGEASLDVVDGDFMEVMAQVEGEMKVAGSISIQPFVSFTKAFGTNISATIAINAYSQAYTVPPAKVTYQATLVHIPLPNVRVPTQGIDLGDVKAGGSALKSVIIKNTGEKAATMTFKSSDPQFTVPGGISTIGAKGTREIQIKFAPESASAAKSEITVTSNDPDSPNQTFLIGANGADVSGNGGTKGGSDSADSGCGCKTAGTTTSTGGWASIGLLGLGALVILRRRATARAA